MIRQNDTTLLLRGAKLKDGATDEQNKADAAAMKADVRNGLYKSIETPNSMDALQAAVAVMTYAQFRPTILALNPLPSPPSVARRLPTATASMWSAMPTATSASAT